MLDFFMVSTRSSKRGVVEIYPKFIIKQSNDLMIRGGDFYAIWDEERSFWSTDEQDAIRLIDEALDSVYEEKKNSFEGTVKVLHMWDAETGMIDKWHRYCQKQMRDNYHMLDEKVIFSNETVKKRDYASKTLNYPLEKMDTPAYDELMNTLYSPEEKEKIEWAIGSIVTGDSKKIQKFLVLYGAAGTGKSTVLNIIQQLFDGYYSVFDAKALGSSNNVFALEAFKSNPLVAIQHDGDLSKIEDNTRLNSLVAHELMTVNEKFKATYSNRFKAFLFMGTNKPVKITDGKSGLIRRLIDVAPTGKKVHPKTYLKLVKEIEFELPGIAYHCREVYLDDPDKYDNYIPVAMLGASNDFYNFMLDNYYIFKEHDTVTLKQAWEMYKVYCDEAKVPYPLSQRAFKEELKTYFWQYTDRMVMNDERVRHVYSGFKINKFEDVQTVTPYDSEPRLIEFRKRKSIFDKIASDYPAQYANERGTPTKKWAEVTTTLKDIDTSQLHYVKVPLNHIVIDFDIPGEDGQKSFERNLAEASKWPNTYAELSKSGAGIHLHYIYEGDVAKLKRTYDDHIEIKVFTGNSSLRRRYSKSNGLDISVINSGLPLKGEKEMGVDFKKIESEKHLRTMIQKNLNKEIHDNTTQSVNFIKELLDEAYESGLQYDVSDMEGKVFAFAANSTHQADICMKTCTKMKWKSESKDETGSFLKVNPNDFIFFDVEVFPNMNMVCWKPAGEEKNVNIWINPTPQQIEQLLNYKLVGYNNRRYDNHIIFAILMGYKPPQVFDLSSRIIAGDRNAFFNEAYGISELDIYDMSSKKQSLKKFEIELEITHKENAYPWDQDLPEDKWNEVADYCCHDVIATEKVFEARSADWTARKILAALADMPVNTPTNTLTTRIIFGKEREPQDVFNYRIMSEMHDDDIFLGSSKLPFKGLKVKDEHFRFNADMKPIFPGYVHSLGKSTYWGEEVGEGGYVYAEPGMYGHVALLDISSMHPTSIVQEELFGPYTQHFSDILNARIAIKHGDYNKAKTMLNGKLSPYLTDEKQAKDLANALKIAINSVYGLTAAKFNNAFRDPRNKDNIVAKRGALFMVNLKHAVQDLGYTVAHIKTDSIKIPDATPEIIEFVKRFGEAYGYSFEHEATYDRMCLVNDAVYVARVEDDKPYWTATGTQFQVPYVFKTLFSNEPIDFNDMCETKSVTTALYLDFGTDEKPERRFVGRIGRFCPMHHGGKLLREKEGKYSYATGSKGYLWQEAEIVKANDLVDDINVEYYDHLVDEAVKTIEQYGRYEWFVDPKNDISIPFEQEGT